MRILKKVVSLQLLFTVLAGYHSSSNQSTNPADTNPVCTITNTIIGTTITRGEHIDIAINDEMTLFLLIQ